MSKARLWFRFELVELTPPSRTLDLGIFWAEFAEAAQKKCEERYRNLLRKLETGSFELRRFDAEEPVKAANTQRTKRPRDTSNLLENA